MSGHRALMRNLPLAIALTISAVAIVAVLVLRQEDQSRLSDIAMANCLEIQGLKAEFRAEANESYRNLGRTLRVLGIERTPEIEELARRQRDRKLKRFAPRKC
jgi:hypothetical protein